jgi:hypothetical protein
MEPSNGKSALEQLAADKLAADQAALPGGAVEAPAPPAAPPPPTKLAEEDRLAVENIYLKLQNLKLNIDMLDMQKKDAGMQMLQLQDAMRKKQAELSVKYGMPIESTTVMPDGTLKPRVPMPKPSGAMVQGKLADGTPVAIPAEALSNPRV